MPPTCPRLRRAGRARSPLPGGRDGRHPGTPDPAHRVAGAGPRPALRYLLLPELKEINPGNPIQNYYKCFMEQQKFFFDKEAFRRREELLAMP